MNIGADPRVHDAFARRELILRSLAHLTGRAKGWAIEEQTDVEVEGGIEHRLAVLPSLQAYRQYLDNLTFEGGPTMHLEPDQGPEVVSLAPGHYGEVNVKRGRIIELAAGTYFFERLTMESGSGMRTWGGVQPIYVFARDQLILRGDRHGGDTRRVFFGFRGGTLALEPNGLSGTIVAPPANIELPSGRPFFGTLFGADVVLHQDSVLHFDRFPFSWHAP